MLITNQGFEDIDRNDKVSIAERMNVLKMAFNNKLLCFVCISNHEQNSLYIECKFIIIAFDCILLIEINRDNKCVINVDNQDIKDVVRLMSRDKEQDISYDSTLLTHSI